MRLPAPLFNRKKDSHKRDFGHIFILAGSPCYTGAALLCSRAAMRAGAGMVTLGIPKGLHPIIAGRAAEVMTLPLSETEAGTLSEKSFEEIIGFAENADCLLVGPGLSREAETQCLVRRVLGAVQCPCVIDADGLNALVGHLDVIKEMQGRATLTPHPAEMARLVGADVSSIQKDRKKVAKDFSVRYNSYLVLKGFKTVVASPEQRIFMNTTGNPGMATAGSGDVLAGIIAAFVGQGVALFEAAQFAVSIHGVAGDLAAREKTEISLIASDIIDYLPEALRKAQRQKS